MSQDNGNFKFTKRTLEDAIMSLNSSEISDFTDLNLIKSWRSNHADFSQFTIVNQNEKLNLVIKKFFEPISYQEGTRLVTHEPDFLYKKEKRNLELISRILPQKLTPEIYGYSDENNLLIINYLGNKNKKKELELATRKSPGSVENIFLEGVKQIAKFNGVCNAHLDDFNSAHDYSSDLDFVRLALPNILKENLVRFFYQSNSKVRDTIPEYSFPKVLDYLTSKKNLNFETRLGKIKQLNFSFNEKLKLQHNDCNGLNMIGDKLIDLEDFGYGSWTNDISSYCIIVGLGETDVHKNFSKSRELYLCYEDAYKKGDENLIQKLDSYQNGDFDTHLSQIMSKQEKADWTMSFFARAIDKFIQLDSSHNRYATKQDYKKRNNNRFSNFSNIFNAVRYSELIRHVSNEEGVREYFSEYGGLLLDLGLNSGNYSQEKKKNFERLLKGIKS